MSTHTLSITIGRNVTTGPDSAPLSRTDWARFQDEAIRRTVIATRYDLADPETETLSDEPFSIHYGTGQWEGTAEESAILTWIDIRPALMFDAEIRDRLSRHLAQVARAFGQESIAVTWGTTTLTDGTPAAQ